MIFGGCKISTLLSHSHLLFVISDTVIKCLFYWISTSADSITVLTSNMVARPLLEKHLCPNKEIHLPIPCHRVTWRLLRHIDSFWEDDSTTQRGLGEIKFLLYWSLLMVWMGTHLPGEAVVFTAIGIIKIHENNKIYILGNDSPYLYLPHVYSISIKKPWPDLNALILFSNYYSILHSFIVKFSKMTEPMVRFHIKHLQSEWHATSFFLWCS